MYTLRGANEKEHGPLSAHEVRDWIANGRVTRETPARAANEEQWRPLGQFIEFEAAFAAHQRTGPPPLETRPATYRLLAIFGLVLSSLGFLIVTALAGIVLGVVTLVLHKKRPREFGGPRLATAAIIVGALWLFAVPSFLYFQFNKQRRQFMYGENCHMHARSLAQSLRVISVVNNGAYPNADSWCDAISKEVVSTNHYQCPEDRSGAVCSFAYNAKLSGVRQPNPQTVAIFESELGWNGSGGPTNVLSKPRHHGQVMIGFVNGGVRPVRTQDVARLRWEP